MKARPYGGPLEGSSTCLLSIKQVLLGGQQLGVLAVSVGAGLRALGVKQSMDAQLSGRPALGLRRAAGAHLRPGGGTTHTAGTFDVTGPVKKCASDGAGPGSQTSLICSLSEQQELYLPPGCSYSHHEGPGSRKAPAYQTGKSLLKHIHIKRLCKEMCLMQ